MWPFRCHTITWINSTLLPIRPMGTLYYTDKNAANFIQEKSSKNAVCKWQIFCSGLKVLIHAGCRHPTRPFHVTVGGTQLTLPGHAGTSTACFINTDKIFAQNSRTVPRLEFQSWKLKCCENLSSICTLLQWWSWSHYTRLYNFQLKMLWKTLFRLVNRTLCFLRCWGTIYH